MIGSHPLNIFETIQKETEGLSNRTALVQDDETMSYGELISAAQGVAQSLSLAGVGRLSRVGFLCDDCIDYVVVSLAILSLSAVVVPVSPEQTPAEVANVLERMEVDFLIAEPRLRPEGGGAPLHCAGWLKKEFTLLKRPDAAAPPEGFSRVNPAFIRFSSGTTGASKGVVLSHQAILDRTDAADEGLRVTPDDTVFWVLSMSYHFVVSILLYLRRGATVVLCGQRFPESLIEGLTRHRGTLIYASPFHYSLLSCADSLSADALKDVRLAVSTAMKLPERVASDFFAKFGLELSEAYGIIEVGLPFIKPPEGAGKRGSVGRALPAFEIGLVEPDGDGIGAIRIRGKGMLDAYYSPWRGREEILQDGWFSTGDLGQIDQDGYLFIVGREKDVINFVGMKVFAQEVESVLNEHPLVKESLVYGVAHARYGELPVAKIVLRSGAGDDAVLDTLRRFCYQRLTQYKVPKEFQFTDQLPKTASGKLRRSLP